MAMIGGQYFVIRQIKMIAPISARKGKTLSVPRPYAGNELLQQVLD